MRGMSLGTLLNASLWPRIRYHQCLQPHIRSLTVGLDREDPYSYVIHDPAPVVRLDSFGESR